MRRTTGIIAFAALLLVAVGCGTGPESVTDPTSVAAGRPEAPPSDDLKVERQEANGTPILAAVNARGETVATYERSSSASGLAVVIRLRANGVTTSTFEIRLDPKNGQGVITTNGQIGDGSFAMEKDSGEAQLSEAARSVEPWSELFATALNEPESSNHIAKASPAPVAAEGHEGDESRGLVCASICGVVASASCKWKTWYGLVICTVGGTYVCDGVCADVPKGQMACFTSRSGQCVRQTCCQPIWGCYTTNVRGCPY